jgi:hypothetical protein
MFNILLVTCLTEILEWYGVWCICGKTTVLNRQLVSTHHHLMHCGRTTVGFKLPEDGVNKHRNT